MQQLQFQILNKWEVYRGIKMYFAVVSKFIPPVIDPEILEKTRELIGEK